MKKAASILLVMSLIANAPLALANSVTYKISVTIPAIIGVNVPDPDEPSIEEIISSNSDLESQMVTVIRHNEKVVLKTLTAR